MKFYFSSNDPQSMWRVIKRITDSLKNNRLKNIKTNAEFLSDGLNMKQELLSKNGQFTNSAEFMN